MARPPPLSPGARKAARSASARPLKGGTVPVARPRTRAGAALTSLSDEPLIPHASVLQINDEPVAGRDPSSEDFRFYAQRSDTTAFPIAPIARIAYQPVADRRRDRRPMRA